MKNFGKVSAHTKPPSENEETVMHFCKRKGWVSAHTELFYKKMRKPAMDFCKNSMTRSLHRLNLLPKRKKLLWISAKNKNQWRQISAQH
jgi:hypothetical protein